MNFSALIDSRRKKLIALLLCFLIVLLVATRLTSRRDTAGDVAAKDSPAFLVYKDDVYEPTQKAHTDDIIRADFAYFARANYPIYDPDKNPAVKFYITKMTVEGKDAILTGHYEKVKNKVEYRFSKQANERITASITDTKDSRTMSKELPSSNPFNEFVKKLPIVRDLYTLDYMARDASIAVTLTEASQEDLQSAKNFVASELKTSVDELKNFPIAYTFPTNFDDNPSSTYED